MSEVFKFDVTMGSFRDLTSGDTILVEGGVRVVCFEGHLQRFSGGLGSAPSAEDAAAKLADDGGARGIEVCYAAELASGETALILDPSSGLWWPSEKL